MPNKPLNTELLDKAICFAVKAHAGTERRGKGFPYIVHPMEAVAIVATITSDQELLAAAALHDVVEDTDITSEEIAREFGDRVAHLVASETDTPGGTWRERKQAAINRIAQSSHDAKIVAMGDKLSNMRAIARDYELLGDKLWNRFHAPGGKADHEWHYRGLASSLFDLAGTFAYMEFALLVFKVFGEIDMHHPDMLNMSEYEESGGGFNSTSYNHKDGKTMIKFYKEGIGKEIPMQEIMLSSHVLRMGLPTPMSGRLVSDGKRYGAEFRRIKPKESFARYISNRPDSVEDIATRFAKMCKQLHSTECDKEYFGSVVEYYHDIVDKSDFNESEKSKMHAFINNAPTANTCVHGDLHIGNVITTGGILSKEGDERPVADLWIDLGDFRWGHPYYDLGMTYIVCNCLPNEDALYLYHIDNSQLQHVWKVFCREYASTATDDERAAFEAKIRPYAALRMLLFLETMTNNPVEEFMRSFVRKELL